MKIGDKVTTREHGFKDKVGEIVGKGKEGYNWQVRFPDALFDDDTYYFNTTELEVVT